MSFFEQLKRLREAALKRQEGIQVEKAIVNRRDLSELLYHFDRIDSELRDLHGTPATGAGLIVLERQRQIEAEGWTADHDAQHIGEELAFAAICYALPQDYKTDGVHSFWPWDQELWKPSPDDRIRELTKAGALIAAEIDRLRSGGWHR
jgi:hypothetical protein